MGSCISKCKPKKDYCNHVQDKLMIISQNPISSILPKMTTMPSENLKKPLSDPPPSNSSTTSFSCSTNTGKCTMSSSSSASCSSSLSIAKDDRSFSNEFLWSCVKDNPHITSLNYPKAIDENCHEKPFVSAHKIKYSPSLVVASPLVKTKQSVQEKATNNAPTPKKRARASSPTLVRQKSFRKEQNYSNPMPNRALMSSPSPNPRFNIGDNSLNIPANGRSNTRQNVSKESNAVSSNCPKRESFRAPTASPNNRMRKRDHMLISQQVSAKIDEGINKDKQQDMDIVMEDINNPLIALDCFIFL